jgi:membrane peptidoglycan carboxypeptidase
VGYTKGEIPMENVHGISVAGGTFPAEIWRIFMGDALEGTPETPFTEPDRWPTWKPFTRGQYALSYDPNYRPETEETEETEESSKTEQPAGPRPGAPAPRDP